MDNKKREILIKALSIGISVAALAAVVLGIVLVSRFIYNKGLKNDNKVANASPTDVEIEVEDRETTVETTATTEIETTEETTTEETTEEITEEEAEDDEENDTTPPVLLVLNREPQIKQWESFDIHKYIGYADDWDRTPEFKVDGEVDTSALGIYPLKITITDKSGNETVADMNVNVVSEISPGKTRDSIEFDDFIKLYKNPSTELGIDVSRWQGDIDFNKVKEAGCEFVIMRVGGYDDGSVYVDSQYYKNLKNAKAAGLKIGIYYHAEERSVEEVKQNVKWLMGVLDGEKLDYPIAYDWEDFANFESYKINLHDINDIYQTFYDEVTAAGYDAMLYSSKNYLMCLWTNKNKTPVWLAHYIDRTDYTGDYIMWQKDCKGRIDGISGDVDLNIMYIDR